MALPLFRVRSPERDLETDTKRFGRLSQLVRKLRDEIQAERDGLQRRHSDTTMSAAFAQATYENEGDPEISSKVDDLTKSMMRYSDRLSALEKQIEFFDELEEKVGKFATEFDR